MIAVIINTLAVLIGSAVGLLLKKGISQRLTDALMKGLGLCTLYIGWSGTMKGENTLVAGYAAQGRLFAIGYLKGLLEMAKKGTR